MRRNAILALAAATLMICACNTVAGVGRDAQSAGRAITGAAEDVRR